MCGEVAGAETWTKLLQPTPAQRSSYTQIATPTGTSFNNTGLVVGTIYRYRVRAHDDAGNHSGYSAAASATAGTPTVDKEMQRVVQTARHLFD